MLNSGKTLLGQVQSSGGRVRFNKGTLQTWLIFCSWAVAANGPLPGALLGSFEEARSSFRKGVKFKPEGLEGVISVYDDRASYRVTDVSSVLARDLAVHLFSVIAFGTTGVLESELLAEELRAAPADRAQALMFEYIDRTHWGDHSSGKLQQR